MEQQKYRLWAFKDDRKIEGELFHLFTKNLKVFCKTLVNFRWKIVQIKKEK